jgi:hypothetical protein
MKTWHLSAGFVREINTHPSWLRIACNRNLPQTLPPFPHRLPRDSFLVISLPVASSPLFLRQLQILYRFSLPQGAPPRPAPNNLIFSHPLLQDQFRFRISPILARTRWCCHRDCKHPQSCNVNGTTPALFTICAAQIISHAGA